MRFLLSVTALLFFCLTLTAHADTFELFTLNANVANGATITGTVDLDLSSTLTHDPFDSTANLIYTLGATMTPITGTNVLFAAAPPEDNVEIEFDFDTGEVFVLALPTSTPDSLADFTGGLCTGGCTTVGNSEISTVNGDIPVTSGTFVPTPAVPEPASLTLLGTGLLGTLRFTRRRHSN